MAEKAKLGCILETNILFFVFDLDFLIKFSPDTVCG